MEKYCILCGMPLKNLEDVALEVNEGSVCKFCLNEDRSLKSCQEVYDGGVVFFMNSIPGANKALAERITRKNMNSLVYWQSKNEECLKGEQATDEEFKESLDKLHTEIEKGNTNIE
jgi:hypothetical protein